MPCACKATHVPRRIVLTGGPGAGKTAALELIRRCFCEHVVLLPEAAGILFLGGFPRGPGLAQRRAAQRAIFHVQRELESTTEEGAPALVVCDRGTIDGMAYWPGPDDFWMAIGTTVERELTRYDGVLHMRTPQSGEMYNHANPMRVESAPEAGRIDERIREAWSVHPHRVEISATPRFLEKAAIVLELIRNELPDCCRPPARPA